STVNRLVNNFIRYWGNLLRPLNLVSCPVNSRHISQGVILEWPPGREGSMQNVRSRLGATHVLLRATPRSATGSIQWIGAIPSRWRHTAEARRLIQPK